MTESRSKPDWKRFLVLIFLTIAGGCTMLTPVLAQEESKQDSAEASGEQSGVQMIRSMKAKTVSMDLQNQSLKEALDLLVRKASLDVTLKEGAEIILRRTTVTHAFENAYVEEVLRKLLGKHRLAYHLNNRGTLVIAPEGKVSSPSSSEEQNEKDVTPTMILKGKKKKGEAQNPADRNVFITRSYDLRTFEEFKVDILEKLRDSIGGQGNVQVHFGSEQRVLIVRASKTVQQEIRDIIRKARKASERKETKENGPARSKKEEKKEKPIRTRIYDLNGRNQPAEKWINQLQEKYADRKTVRFQFGKRVHDNQKKLIVRGPDDVQRYVQEQLNVKNGGRELKENTGRVIGVDDAQNRVVLNLGKSDGFRDGLLVSMYRDQKMEKISAYAVVRTLHADSSVATVVKDLTGSKPQAGDWIKPLPEQASKFFIDDRPSSRSRTVIGRVETMKRDQNELTLNIGRAHGVRKNDRVRLYSDQHMSSQQAEGVVISVRKRSSTVKLPGSFVSGDHSDQIQSGQFAKVVSPFEETFPGVLRKIGDRGK